MSACSAAPSDARRARVHYAAPYVVRLEAPTAAGLMVGTGFQMRLPGGRRYIMTARHVCDEAFLGLLLFVNKRPLRVVKRSAKYDLCVMEPIRPYGGLLLSARAPQPYSDAWTLGHPDGEPLQYYEGYYTGTTVPRPKMRADMYSFPAAGGQSGSPVLDRAGHVVGVVAWQFGPTGQAAAVRWQDMRDFIWSEVMR